MTTSYVRTAISLCLSLVISLSPGFDVGLAKAGSFNDSALTIATTNLLTDGNLPGGTSISVAINSPADGAVFATGDFPVNGTASIGMGIPVPNTLLVYVLDVSFSTQDTGGCGGDQNGDGSFNRILDCEIAAAKALNSIAVSTGTVGAVGVAVFGGHNVGDPADTGGEAADVGPDSGDQLTTGPGTDADGVGGRDVEQVLSSAFSTSAQDGGVNLFTIRNAGSDGTNFARGITAAVNVVAATPASITNKIVVFMSDGLANTGPSVSSALPSVPAGVNFFTFAVGSESSCTNNSSGLGTLQQIAIATGGTCTPVADVASLPSVIPSIVASQLLSLEQQLDGGAFTAIPNTQIDPDLPLSGPASVTYSYPLSSLATGEHTICVRANGSDGGGMGSVTDCHNVKVVDITLTPPTATNELGTPSQTHTVTATVSAGAAGGVSGLTVNFNLLSGPNAGASGSGITDGNGQVTFTYTAIQGPAGLGTDVIEACFGPDEQGDTVCDTATKNWVDTSGPVAACTPTTNPSGRRVPPAGNNPQSGQNPDGFYELTVTDLVDPNPQIFIHDSGSSFVAGPYASGTRIKLVQAPGSSPKVKPGAGEIDWKITLKGDAILIAVDSSGNTSIPASCHVPPPPR